MLAVHLPSKSVVVDVPDPTAITTVLPHSRVVQYEGRPVVQVRYGIDETRVLRNMGIPVASPIRHLYEWRGKYKPYQHQLVTSDFFTLNSRAICLNDMGSGKSVSALWAADYLMDSGVIDKALIVCPRSTMHAVWEDEIVKHFMFNRRCVVLSGSRERRLKLLQQDVDFYIVNHDGVKVIADALKERTDINLWIVDEAAVYRNAATSRYKLIKELVRPTDWLWLMTGTPCPNAPTDAWALSRLINNPSCPKFFNAFKLDTMVQVTQYKWIPKPDAYQRAYDILQPGIRFRKEDCIDLPPVTYQRRLCAMTAEQQRYYQQMHDQLVLQARQSPGQPITAANAAVKLQKLLQIALGCVYDNDGNPVAIDCGDRLATLSELVEEASAKVIVFVPFTGALNIVADHLRQRWSVEIVNGSVGDRERARIFSAFQNEEDPRILVAHPNVTAHGLTLTAADTTIWYAPIFSLEIFEQANNRMNRPGQKNHMTVATIAATPLEQGLYAALGGKAQVQNAVLDLYRREISK